MNKLSYLILIFALLVINACTNIPHSNELTGPNISQNYIPDIVLNDLSGNTQIWPKDTKNLCLATFSFSKEQYQMVQRWHYEFKKIKDSKLISCYYDVPVRSNSFGLIRSIEHSDINDLVNDYEKRAHTLALYTNISEFVQYLGLNDENKPTAILFNNNGDILWSTLNNPNQHELNQLIKALES